MLYLIVTALLSKCNQFVCIIISLDSLAILERIMPAIDYSVCRGTTIVAVRTPEVFAMATDSKGTFEGGGRAATSRPVSKIFQKDGILYAISGLTKDTKRGFDPVASIDDSVSDLEPLQNIANKLEQVLSKALEGELTVLRAEEPELFRQEIAADGNHGTSILLACWENEGPLSIGIHFHGVLNEDGKLAIRTTRLACPGDCPSGIFTFFLGHHTAIDKYVAQRGNICRCHQKMV